MDKYRLNVIDLEIEQLAYRLWQERGRPPGSPDEDWYRAEMSLREGALTLANRLKSSQLPFASIKMGY